ncbi:hypothetical protein GCM10018785_06240 [Streptomyces longispororuber]|uniref:Uncharacterized protein n=1 Tax=Streptomyces longispororuber TaxID=68230 RepID=A0A918Z9E7_9ACTN|nr:hypothetical protein GCM10018785_06240 [Streptomyces longispororuber]
MCDIQCARTPHSALLSGVSEAEHSAPPDAADSTEGIDRALAGKALCAHAQGFPVPQAWLAAADGPVVASWPRWTCGAVM